MSGVVCRQFIQDHKRQVDAVMKYFGHETLAKFLEDCLEDGLYSLTMKMQEGIDHDEDLKRDERMSDEEFRAKILKPWKWTLKPKGGEE